MSEPFWRRSRNRGKIIIPSGYDTFNPTVKQRFSGVISDNDSLGDSGDIECGCFYQAGIDVSIRVMGKLVTWTCTAYEKVWCYAGGTWDTGGWERGTFMGPNSGIMYFSMNLAKVCDPCQDCSMQQLKTYYNGVTQGTPGYDYGDLKKAPAWVRTLASGGADSNLTDPEANTLMDELQDFMKNGAKDGWDTDPADKDCAEINGYCAGASIS